MGDMQHLSPTRTQVPPHLRSKTSSTSMQRNIFGFDLCQSVAEASISTSASVTFAQKQVPWLDQAFQKVSAKTVLHRQLSPVIRDMQIKQLFASFRRGQSMDADIDEFAFHVEVPLSVRFDVLSVQADVEVHYEGYGCVGTGRIDTNVQSCTPVEESQDDVVEGGVSKSSRMVRLAPGSFKLVTEHTEGLAQLIAHIADCDEATTRISIRGKARARVEVALGEIYVDVDLGSSPHPTHGWRAWSSIQPCPVHQLASRRSVERLPQDRLLAVPQQTTSKTFRGLCRTRI